jgi:hypothetical protein
VLVCRWSLHDLQHSTAPAHKAHHPPGNREGEREGEREGGVSGWVFVFDERETEECQCDMITLPQHTWSPPPPPPPPPTAPRQTDRQNRQADRQAKSKRDKGPSHMVPSIHHHPHHLSRTKHAAEGSSPAPSSRGEMSDPKQLIISSSGAKPRREDGKLNHPSAPPRLDPSRQQPRPAADNF